MKTTLYGLAALLAVGGCSGEALLDHGDNPADSRAVELPIHNGTVPSKNYRSVAIYHQRYDAGVWGWNPRPCSGTVLRRLKGVTVILTARHCVTDDGMENGTPVTAASVKVTTEIQPGLANPNPPASAVAVAGVNAHPPATGQYYWLPQITVDGTSYANPYFPHDLALITVNQELPLDTVSTTQISSTTNNPFRAMGIRLTAITTGSSLNLEGYGRSTEGTNNGAGTLRTASGFTVNTVYSDVTAYGYYNDGNDGAMLDHGDSGGGTYVRETAGSIYWYDLVGVHSRYDGPSDVGEYVKDAMVPGPNDWILRQLGFLYLTSAYGRRYNLGLTETTPQVGAGLDAGKTGDMNSTRWSFLRKSASEGEIRIYPGTRYQYSKLCLEHPASGGPQLATCNSSNRQRWQLISNHRLRNKQTQMCLAYGTPPTMSTCSTTSSRQVWIWHPQP